MQDVSDKYHNYITNIITKGSNNSKHEKDKDINKDNKGSSSSYTEVINKNLPLPPGWQKIRTQNMNKHPQATNLGPALRASDDTKQKFMNLHIGTPSVNDENNSINSNHPSFHDDESVDNDGNDKYNSPRMVNNTYQRQSYTPRSNSSSFSRDIQKIEKRTPLNPKIIWSGDIAKFREFKSQ